MMTSLDTEFETPAANDPYSRGHWLARNPMRSAFLVITVLALVIRGSVLKDSSFITDDFMLSARAMESPLSWHYLTRVHTGHFEPIGFATMWLLAHMAPLNWGWTCAVLLAGQGLLSVMVWRLLTELFGRKPLILVPYVVFAFTPLTLPAFTWLSAAIIWLPLMLSVAGATRWHTRFVRSGRLRDAIYATAWFAVGLASFEKIVVYLPFIVVFTVALQPEMRVTTANLLKLLRRTLTVWIGYFGASVIYLGIYIAGTRVFGGNVSVVTPKAGPLSDFTFLSIFRTFIPSAFGGPWSWQPLSAGLALVDSPRAFDWSLWIAAFAVVVGSLLTRRNIGRFWFALLAYLGGSLMTIAVGRVGYGGAMVALETRYLADAAVPLVVVISACLLPLQGEATTWTPQGKSLAAMIRPGIRYACLLGILTLVVSLSVHAMGGYATFSTVNPSRQFLANTKNSLMSLPPSAQIYDTELPGQLIGSIFGEYNQVSRYISPLVSPKERRTLYTQNSWTHPYVVDSAGSFVPMQLSVGAASTAPLGSCTSAFGGSVSMPLNKAVFNWGWAVRIGYIADSQGSAIVRLGTADVRIPFTTGLGEVYVKLVGAGSSVRVTDITPGVKFCVGDVQVGLPSPKG